MQWEENRTNFDRNFAVVIGINRYNSNCIHDLKTAVGNASAIADLLEKEYGYKRVVHVNSCVSSGKAKTMFV